MSARKTVDSFLEVVVELDQSSAFATKTRFPQEQNEESEFRLKGMYESRIF